MNGLQIGEFLIGFVMMLLAVWGVFAKFATSFREDLVKQQADLKNNLHEAISELRATHERRFEESRQLTAGMTENLNRINLQINTILEGNVRRLEERVARLESGQDEWTKTLRERTHLLGNELNSLRLEVELVKAGRPAPGKP